MSTTPTPGTPTNSYRPDGFIRRNALGVLAVLIALALLAGVGYGGYRGVAALAGVVKSKVGTPDYTGAGKAPIVVVVHRGDTVSQIAMNLKRQNVVKSSKAFRSAAMAEPAAQNIESGYYRLRTELPAKTALAMLLNDKSMIVTKVTIPEGWTKERIADELTRRIKVTSGPSFRQLIAKPTGLKLPAYANGNLEGILFPATYKFPPSVTATEVLQAMVDRFVQSADELNLVTNAKALGVSPRSILILASIIQSETGQNSDAAKISRVFWNRLQRDLRLQSDATVVYAIGKAGKIGRTATTTAERGVQSRYNTYRHKGLPVGAISNPGDLALTAAMEPATGNWLYFTLVNVRTGETAFADSEAEARQNVTQLQTWCQASPVNHKMCFGN